MKTSIFFMLPAFLLLAFANDSGQRTKRSEKTILLTNVKELETEIDFPVEELRLYAISDNEMKGIFKYSKDKWKPKISYRNEDQRGYLKMASEVKGKIRNYDESDQNIWDVAFNKRVWHDLDIDFDAGKGDIDLQGCRLKRFEFSMAAGETNINLRNTSVPDLEFKAMVGEATIDLSGEWNNDLDAEIRGGMGELTLILPSQTGIELDIHGVLGEVNVPHFRKDGTTYTNKQYGETENHLYIDLRGGIGEINVQTRMSKK